MAKKITEEENTDVADEEPPKQPTEDAEEDDDAPAAGELRLLIFPSKMQDETTNPGAEPALPVGYFKSSSARGVAK
eukprot:scaffold99047_cov55-Attheya_sp.AAC.5